MCTSACSLRPWMNGSSLLSWSNAWPSPATFPWPKIPSAAGISRRRCPSATEYCRERYVTRACATVSRTVPRDVLPMIRTPIWIAPLAALAPRGSRNVAAYFVVALRKRVPTPPQHGAADPICLPGPAVQNDRLEIRHFFDGPAWSFLADSAALEPAVRHQIRAPQRGPVDVNAASIDLPHGADGARDVGSEDSSGQPVRRAVRLPHRGVPVFSRTHCDRGSEQLVLSERRRRIYIGDHSGRHHAAVSFSTGEDPRPGGSRRSDRLPNPFGFAGGDQCSHAGLGRGRVAHANGLHLGHQRVEEIAANRRVSNNPLNGDAHLAGIDVAASGDRAGGEVKVCVRHDDHRTRAPELE